jgi:hypothetical protein
MSLEGNQYAMSDLRPEKPPRQPDYGSLTRGPAWAQTPFLIFCALALIFLGVLGLSQSIRQTSELNDLRNGRGEVVVGTVVDVIKQTDSRRGSGIGAPRIYRYCPEYQFETLDGDIYQMEATEDCSEDVEKLRLGAEADIIYDPSDPTISYVDSDRTLTGGLVLGGGAFLVGVSMIGVYIWIRVGARGRGRRRANVSRGPSSR